ncbi:MAG: helix-turn-helix domain-containing protein [Desulfobacterales bacterium]|nr:helix-turn-helix domain-containing protein [Desulfobacterales bacterium]
MIIHLHKNARTTPIQREFIQNNPQIPVSVMARKLGVSETTIRRWKKRKGVMDRSHVPKRIQTVLSPSEAIKLIVSRMVLRSSLDDLHRLMEATMPFQCSRATLNRYLGRYHISRLPSLKKGLSFKLNDYRGTYLYYNQFVIPGPGLEDVPICIQTLLDCSFRIFHSELNPLDSRAQWTFLDRYLGQYPLRVLGLIQAPAFGLCLHLDSDLARTLKENAQATCRELGLVHVFKDSPHGKTLAKIQENSEKLEPGEPGLCFGTLEEMQERMARHMEFYNNQLPQKALREKTPSQAMAFHHRNFPGSFHGNPQDFLANIPGRVAMEEEMASALISLESENQVFDQRETVPG